MSEPISTATDISHAELEWDEEGQPQSQRFGDVYFSRTNGLDETRHVFLHHNQLPQRWATLNAQDTFTIGETGFGSGLNFLAAWQLWDQTAPRSAQLHFVSVEKYPLKKTDLIRVLALWPELKAFSQALIDQYPVFVGTGFHRLKFDQGRVNLTLIINDAATGFEQLLGSAHPLFAAQCAKIDAWFLDGFAPSKNPQMWSDELFDALGALSDVHTTAATFSAAGIVKRGLIRAGFEIKKVAGFGRKREMITAQLHHLAPPLTAQDLVAYRGNTPYPTPWAVTRNPGSRHTRSLIVIGAGLAGCHTARALAERGWQVTVVEREAKIAAAASGNPQGILYAKLSARQEALSLFNLTCLQYAQRHYRQFWDQTCSETGTLIAQNCGVLQLANDASEQKLQAQLQETFAHAQELVRFVSAHEASELAGIELTHAGLFFPRAGWVSPRLVCERLLQHPNIKTLCNTEVLSLESNRALDSDKVFESSQEWHIRDNNNQLLLSANNIVIANARDATHFAQCVHLPINFIRGQITYLPATHASQTFKTVVCGDGYVGPAYHYQQQRLHFTGATFNLKQESLALNFHDHQTNLDRLNQLAPALVSALGDIDIKDLEGRAGFRCTTRDYLPMVGPVPDYDAFLRDFAPVRKNAKAAVPLAGDYYQGLYLNIGHGSRGIAYTPLCAELLAAHINQEVLPVDRDLAQALNPARFILRDLARGKI